jgi:hypothetical protein
LTVAVATATAAAAAPAAIAAIGPDRWDDGELGDSNDEPEGAAVVDPWDVAMLTVVVGATDGGAAIGDDVTPA